MSHEFSEIWMCVNFSTLPQHTLSNVISIYSRHVNYLDPLVQARKNIPKRNEANSDDVDEYEWLPNQRRRYSDYGTPLCILRDSKGISRQVTSSLIPSGNNLLVSMQINKQPVSKYKHGPVARSSEEPDTEEAHCVCSRAQWILFDQNFFCRSSGWCSHVHLLNFCSLYTNNLPDSPASNVAPGKFHFIAADERNLTYGSQLPFLLSALIQQ